MINLLSKFLIIFTILLFSFQVVAQKMPAYKIYNANGKKRTYKQMMKELKNSDIVMFGESHNNPISHWLQLEVTKDLYESDSLILGAEMMETDNQDELNLYLIDSIDYEGLDTMARLWSNFKTDYKPLVDFAKDHNLPFIATNIPRRYAKLVYRGGFEALDTLPDNDKQWIAPLPVKFDSTLPRYQNILTMMGDHGNMKLVKAQAIKDATMAYNILKHYSQDAIFIHYNGSYHSDFHEGIVWYLKQKNPELKITTITTRSQDDVGTLSEDHEGAADFIIVVDSDMTTTY